MYENTNSRMLELIGRQKLGDSAQSEHPVQWAARTFERGDAINLGG